MSMFPEGVIALASDDELRSTSKWAQQLFATVGNKGGPWPEGTTPMAGDDQDRLLAKIDRMLQGGMSVVPPAPTNLVATPGNTTNDLTWTASAGALSYNVKRSTVAGGPYSTIATGVLVTNYHDTGLTNGTTYYYVVSASNGAGQGSNSNQASGTPNFSDNPLNYPAIINWVKADTLALNDGDQISFWGDQTGGSGNNWHAPVGIPPTYHTNASGSSPAAVFGVAPQSNLTDQVPSFTLNGAWTVMAAVIAAGDSMLLGSLGGNKQIRVKRSGANIISAYDGANEVLSSALANPASALRLLTWRFAAGGLSFYEGVTARGAGGFADMGTINWMGSSAGTGVWSNCSLFELVVYQADIGVPAIQSLANNYFSAKYPTLVL